MTTLKCFVVMLYKCFMTQHIAGTLKEDEILWKTLLLEKDGLKM